VVAVLRELTMLAVGLVTETLETQGTVVASLDTPTVELQGMEEAPVVLHPEFRTCTLLREAGPDPDPPLSSSVW